MVSLDYTPERPSRWRQVLGDIIPRVLLVAFYGNFGVGFGREGLARLGPALTHGWLSAEALQIYPTLGKSVFMLMIAVLAIIRSQRIAGDASGYARAVALAGTFFLILIPWVPMRSVLPTGLAATCSILMLAGSIASVLVVACLGRSFSILPEARRLVVSGPYRIIRHPLYMAEELMMLGFFLQYPVVWTIAMTASHGWLQIERMRLEERVLTAAFPAYADYASRTWRVIPGIY